MACILRETVVCKPKVAKTMNNWLQAFSVLGCVMGEKHPERCSELFIYLDFIYSAYKSHGGLAWWRYDEQFRRKLTFQPEIGWGMKAMDVWLLLMMSQKPVPFPSTAAKPGIGPGSVAGRRTGTCWLFNEGHCKFYGLCKFRHECSSCGGNHPAAYSQKSLGVGNSRVMQKTPVSAIAMQPWLDL